MKKPVIGLALGGGAARGWAHIGIIDVLREEGIKADVVTGTSIGSFVGAAEASGKIDALREWALALNWREVATMFDVSLLGGGLIEGNQILGQMEKLGISGKIEDMPKTFAAIATNYTSGLEVWLDKGDLQKSVRASIALPGILSPVWHNNAWLVDGGLVNPVPVTTCRAKGADFIIAVNLNGDLHSRNRAMLKPKKPNPAIAEKLERSLAPLPASWKEGTMNTVSQFLAPKKAKPGYFHVLANSIDIMQDKITRSRLLGDPPHVLLTPRVGNLSIFDFDEAERAIEEGRRCARHALSEIHYQLDLLRPIESDVGKK